MSKYDSRLFLNENSSNAKILKQVRKNTQVLEFGCACGKMTRYMKEQLGCSVYIVEMDEEAFHSAMAYAQDGLCADLEQMEWLERFADVKFDSIIFADVLEHLRRPDLVLKKAGSLLKDDGMVLLSVPNIAHSDILVNLYENNFQYMPLGLLDDTHIHFWGSKNLEKFCNDAGYQVVVEDATRVEPFLSEQGQWIDSEKKTFYAQLLYGKEQYDVYQFLYTLQKKEYAAAYGLRKICKIERKFFVMNGSVIFDYGSGFAPETVQELYPVKSYEDRFYYEIHVPQGVQHVVFHPVREKACIVFNLQAVSDRSGSIVPVQVKGTVLQNSYLFVHHDPCMVFACKDTSWIKISLHIMLLERESQIAAVSSIVSVLESERADRQKRLEDQIADLERQHRDDVQALEKEAAQKQRIIDRNREKIKQMRKAVKTFTGKTKELEHGYTEILKQMNRKLQDQQALMIRMQQEKEYADSNANAGTGDQLVFSYEKRFINCRPIDPGRSVFFRTEHRMKNEYGLFGNKTNAGIPQAYVQKIAGEAAGLSEIMQLASVRKRIAVHLHLYYTDLLPEFFNYLNNIPFVYDLYISCRQGEDLKEIAKKFARLRYVNDVIVRVTENRGRDIAPLYVLFGKEILKHDYFLHIHSKKSLHSGCEQTIWRTNALDCVLGCEEQIRKIFMLFEGNRKIGLFFPETVGLHLIAQSWLKNAAVGKGLLNEIGLSCDDDLFNYPVGSFFWANTQAVKPLFERKFTYDDFPEEQKQIDGTLAHALERVVALTARGQGYEPAICDKNAGIVRFGKSYQLYQNYFSQSKLTAADYLSGFSCITFDIFDTLITRKIYEPDDLFLFMEELIADRYGISCNFLEVRKKAESAAWQKYAAGTSIHQIYEELQIMMNLSKEKADALKQLEIDLELEFALPRKDVREIYLDLIKRHKKVILISDMYLTRDIIEQLLAKCGYYGYTDVWVSCERGSRKDDGSLWADFFERYGSQKTVHVGDNMCSDIQVVGDLRKDTYYIMNPVTAFKLSKEYGQLKKYLEHRTTAVSLLFGLLIQAGIYNSPFCLDASGEPVIEDGAAAGYLMAGPIFTKFMQWLTGCVDPDMTLLFLSREGYVLKQLYEQYCKESNCKPCGSTYFLASRRAVSMATVQNETDVEEILEQDYQGSFQNLLWQRFGVRAAAYMQEVQIKIPEDLAIVKKLIVPYMPEIVKRAQKEREAYLLYAQKILAGKEEDKLCVVDLGYAGTIQYFLSKMLDHKIAGRYLCTGEKVRPAKLGCQVTSLFAFDRKRKTDPRFLFESAYLEAILEAPFGQLVKFQLLADGQVQPVYKEENQVSYDVLQMQAGVAAFMKAYLKVCKEIGLNLSIDENAALAFVNVIGRNGMLSQSIADSLKVEDGYCQDGVMCFSRYGVITKNLNEKK